MNNKKAQIGSTMTWIIATLIIVVILSFSIYLVSFSVGGKRNIDVVETTDLFVVKSLSGYLMTPEAGATVLDEIRSKQDFSGFNGPLALFIFRDFYSHEFFTVWVGVIEGKLFNQNPFFGIRKNAHSGEAIYANSVGSVASEKTKLDYRKKELEVLASK